jgi:hypothetical protein
MDANRFPPPFDQLKTPDDLRRVREWANGVYRRARAVADEARATYDHLRALHNRRSEKHESRLARRS